MNARILVVEDDEKSLFIFTRLLGLHAGYEVIQARDGYEAVEAAKQAQPDVILLDILLPGMDGYQVAAELRSLPAFDQVPILAVSALPLMSNRERALAAGCDAYLEKPIDPASLVETVKEYVALVNQGFRFVAKDEVQCQTVI